MNRRTRTGLQSARDRASKVRARLSGLTRDLAADVDHLSARVSQLEEEVQESRRLNRRLAELTDVVQELLLPLSERDEEKVRDLLDGYTAQL